MTLMYQVYFPIRSMGAGECQHPLPAPMRTPFIYIYFEVYIIAPSSYQVFPSTNRTPTAKDTNGAKKHRKIK